MLLGGNHYQFCYSDKCFLRVLQNYRHLLCLEQVQVAKTLSVDRQASRVHIDIASSFSVVYARDPGHARDMSVQRVTSVHSCSIL